MPKELRDLEDLDIFVSMNSSAWIREAEFRDWIDKFGEITLGIKKELF